MDINEAKTAIKNKTIVRHHDINYIVSAAILRHEKGEWKYSLELMDLKAKHSVVIADINKVKES